MVWLFFDTKQITPIRGQYATDGGDLLLLAMGCLSCVLQRSEKALLPVLFFRLL